MVYSNSLLSLMPPSAPWSMELLFQRKSRAVSSIIATDYHLTATSTSLSTPSFVERSKLSGRHAPSLTPNKRANWQRRIKMSLLGSRSSSKALKVARPTIQIHCEWLTTLDKKSTKTIRLLIGKWPTMNKSPENRLRKSVFKRNAMKSSKKSLKSKKLSTLNYWRRHPRSSKKKRRLLSVGSKRKKSALKERNWICKPSLKISATSPSLIKRLWKLDSKNWSWGSMSLS